MHKEKKYTTDSTFGFEAVKKWPVQDNIKRLDKGGSETLIKLLTDK